MLLKYVEGVSGPVLEIINPIGGEGVEGVEVKEGVAVHRGRGINAIVGVLVVCGHLSSSQQ